MDTTRRVFDSLDALPPDDELLVLRRTGSPGLGAAVERRFPGSLTAQDYFLVPNQDPPRDQRRVQTNMRYDGFFQRHFTAGDEQQFCYYRGLLPALDPTEKQITNRFSGLGPSTAFFADQGSTAVRDTFEYIFRRYKKAIFVRIRNNRLGLFLPFSNARYQNDWGSQLTHSDRFRNLIEVLRYAQAQSGFYFDEQHVLPVEQWYANNGLVRYEKSGEGDSGVAEMFDMLRALCAERRVADCEFFLNKRDFPLVRTDGEAYEALYAPGAEVPRCPEMKFAPVLSMTTTADHEDLAVPTWDDWGRVPNDKGPRWEDRQPQAVFRGQSTGLGLTAATNPRLRLVELSISRPDLLDAGITRWNLRPRVNSGRLDVMEKEPWSMQQLWKRRSVTIRDARRQGLKLSPKTLSVLNAPFDTAPYMSPADQARFKYVVNVEGHSAAYRLSRELASGSVVLLQESRYLLWFRPMLQPYVHYVPITLENVLEQIEWCRCHDTECRQIVLNACEFSERFLGREGVLDYWEDLLCNLKCSTGTPAVFGTTVRDISRRVEAEVLLPKLNISESLPRTRIFVNKNVVVHRIGNQVIKTLRNQVRRDEQIHSAFIGLQAVNKLVRVTPNFHRTYAATEREVLSEYVAGPTLFEALWQRQLSVVAVARILAQVCLAIETAQNLVGFIHNDLSPANIILRETPRNSTVDYVLGDGARASIGVDVSAVVIDYGGSQAIVGDVLAGFTRLFRADRFHDLLQLLLTTLDLLCKHPPPNEDAAVVRLGSFLCGGTYRPDIFHDLLELTAFVRRAKKFSALQFDDKQDMAEKTPRDLLLFLKRNFHVAVDIDVGATAIAPPLKLFPAFDETLFHSRDRLMEVARKFPLSEHEWMSLSEDEGWDQKINRARVQTFRKLALLLGLLESDEELVQMVGGREITSDFE